MLRRHALIVPAVLWGWPARASGGTAAVSVKYVTRVARGQRPKLVLVANEPIGKIVVTLTRDDGKVVRAGFASLAAGAVSEVLLLGDPGTHRYQGTIAVNQGGVDHDSSVSFEAAVADSLTVQVWKDKVDVAARTLVLRVSREPALAEIAVRGAGGKILAQDSQDLAGRKADEDIVLKWPASTGDIARIDVKITDSSGYFAGVALMPWSVQIPHEEVVFSSDSAAIAAVERGKLEASLKLIAAALTRHRELGPIKLFVAGHTDTQGSPAHNLDLSQKRARAIAGYFRKRGLRIPIFFEGFGEHALRVATADTVDEPRNRRVDYILALDEPPLRATAFTARWKPVK